MVAPNGSGPTIDLPSHLERVEERTAFGDSPRAGAGVRGEISLVARSPLAGQISLGGTGRWNRYRALPRPPFDLSVTNLRRLGRTLATRDTSPRSPDP